MWNPFARKDAAIEPEKKSLVLGTSPETGSFLLFGRGGATTAAGALNLYSDSTAVSIPVNMVAEAFASYYATPRALVDKTYEYTIGKKNPRKKKKK